MLRNQRKWAEAEPLFQQVLDKHRRLSGEEHGNTIMATMRMASLRVAQRKYPEALALITPIEGKVLTAIPGITGVLRNATLLGVLGQVRAGLAKSSADYIESEKNLFEAQSTSAKMRGEGDKEALDWARVLVDLYIAWDRVEPPRVKTSGPPPGGRSYQRRPRPRLVRRSDRQSRLCKRCLRGAARGVVGSANREV